jgi:hypothetical protein
MLHDQQHHGRSQEQQGFGGHSVSSYGDSSGYFGDNFGGHGDIGGYGGYLGRGSTAGSVVARHTR